MNVLDAIEKAENNENIKTLKDFVLGSAFACVKDKEEITQWTILFYNPRTKKVIDCFVNEKFVTPGEETPALYETDELKEEDINKMKITVEKALEIAKEGVTKSIVNIMISLHKRDSILWSISIVATDMTALTIDINAETGDTIKKEETKLIRQL
jgi:hypothetical protein